MPSLSAENHGTNWLECSPSDPKYLGGQWSAKTLVLLHPVCHVQVHQNLVVAAALVFRRLALVCLSRAGSRAKRHMNEVNKLACTVLRGKGQQCPDLPTSLPAKAGNAADVLFSIIRK